MLTNVSAVCNVAMYYCFTIVESVLIVILCSTTGQKLKDNSYVNMIQIHMLEHGDGNL